MDINYLNINLSIRPHAGGCKDHTTPRRTLIQRTEGNFIVPVIAKFSRWESAAPASPKSGRPVLESAAPASP